MYKTNGDKILKAVLADERLITCYEYNPNDYDSILDALNSDVTIIKAIAYIINRNEEKATEKEIYNEVSNILKANI